MGFLPSPDIDFSKMSKEERETLVTHLKTEHAKTVARKIHLEELLTKLGKY